MKKIFSCASLKRCLVTLILVACIVTLPVWALTETVSKPVVVEHPSNHVQEISPEEISQLEEELKQLQKEVALLR